MGTDELLGKPNKLQGNYLRLTSIPSMGSRNTPSRVMLQKPGYVPAAMSQSAPRRHFQTPCQTTKGNVVYLDSRPTHYTVLKSFDVNG